MYIQKNIHSVSEMTRLSCKYHTMIAALYFTYKWAYWKEKIKIKETEYPNVEMNRTDHYFTGQNMVQESPGWLDCPYLMLKK